MHPSGRPTRDSPRCPGPRAQPFLDPRRLSLSHPPTPSLDHSVLWVDLPVLLVRPTSIGALRARRASSASTTGSVTRMSFMSAGASTLVPSLAATAVSGVPTLSTSITSSATAARRALMPKRSSNSYESASTGLAASALLCTQPVNVTLSTSPATSNRA